MIPTIEGKLEGLLFLYGEPAGISQLASTLGVSEEMVRRSLDALRENLRAENRGLALVIHDERVQLVTKPELKEILAKAVEGELDTGLTPASMETLAIVAYLGPCRRSLVEHIRGVNSSFILRSLLIRGLIERMPDPKRANTFLYQVTFDFLRHMGLGATEEMPNYEKYKDFMQFFAGEKKEHEPAE